ncbi:3053_t:CDS:2 [Diversispora eburnea]|uniref:3053_t:CDS:1 n=1 Tax=Diversispora eburnea TaxID=1213867 RepID=A0A9N8YQI3_9GLOM|nr:3053_t:CDS:2 [Diversispora eburnea]
MLDKSGFNARNISDFSDALVKTFFERLAIVTRNPPGIPESSTDAMPYVLTTPEFVVTKGTISMIITETDEVSNQVLFVIRFISTYITFYKAEISSKYWYKLVEGLPINSSLKIKRWPGENYKKNGLDLVDPDGRKVVLEVDESVIIA